MAIHDRVLLNKKDVMTVLRCSRSTAYRVCLLIRAEYKRREGKRISIFDFCDYTALSIDHVQAMLFDHDNEGKDRNKVLNHYIHKKLENGQ